MPVLQRKLSRTDEARTASTTADLAAALREARATIAQLEQFKHDVADDRISVDDLELQPVDEDDTLVERARVHLRSVGAR